MFVAAVLLCLASPMTSAGWNPDAGLSAGVSLTKQPGAVVIASSNNNTSLKNRANDGDDNTDWVSNGCLPAFYLGNSLTNVLFQACLQERCHSSSDLSGVEKATDVDANTAYTAHSAGSSGAYLAVSLASDDHLRYVSVKGSFRAPTQLLVIEPDTETLVVTLSSSDNYRTQTINVTSTRGNAVLLRSGDEFTVFTLGAVGRAGCVERLAVNLGALRHIRFIRTRQWAGPDGATSRLVVSTDGVTWQTVGQLDPRSLTPYTTTLPTTVSAQFVGVEQTQDEKDYAKVFFFEIDAYDENSPYGPAPSPRPNPVSLRQMLGVNAIWGWGTGRASSTLPPGQGAALYAPVASYARSYHNLNWDVRDPDDVPDYARMAQGQGTEAQAWLNWDEEYGLWALANVSVHVSVQFTAKDFPPAMWDDPLRAARGYGQAFAAHFGIGGMVPSFPSLASFAKKGPYYTLSNLLALLGEAHFLSALQENDDAYVYIFGRLPPSRSPWVPTHLVAWRPADAAGANANREVRATFTYAARPTRAYLLGTSPDVNRTVALPSVSDTNQWTMTISTLPTVVQLQEESSIIGRK